MTEAFDTDVEPAAKPKPTPKPNRRRRRTAAAVLVAAVVGLSLHYGQPVYDAVVWKKFAEVEPGKITRSGQLYLWQMERVIDEYDVRTWICLNDEQAEAERGLCQAKGVDFVRYQMPSDGLGDAADFAKVVRLMDDPKAQPVHVHCNAGVARSGAAVALHRIVNQGWEPQAAIAEQQSFERKGRIDPRLRDFVLDTAEQFRAERLAADLSDKTLMR